MNLLDYLQLDSVKRLDEEQINDLHSEMFTPGGQLVYSIDLEDNKEIWVLKGEENDYHLWEIEYHIRYVGEFTRVDHALIHSRAVEYSMHDILDKLNAVLKGKHPH